MALLKTLLSGRGVPIRVGKRCMGSMEIKKTCLYDFHVAQGGKMVDFAGYYLPIQYSKEGIAASHLHTRHYINVQQNLLFKKLVTTSFFFAGNIARYSMCHICCRPEFKEKTERVSLRVSPLLMS
jgi:hypothetical protein